MNQSRTALHAANLPRSLEAKRSRGSTGRMQMEGDRSESEEEKVEMWERERGERGGVKDMRKEAAEI